MVVESFNWGIMGLGKIARAFAAGLTYTPGARLIAGGSASPDRAEAFRQEFGLARCYASYEELLADPEIHAVYIATRHPLHAQGALACIVAGKHVLVEKPFAMNAKEARLVLSRARTHNVVCLEAMWTRYFPLMTRLRQLLAEGVIGEPRLLQADFSYYTEFDPASRVFDPHLGGGALLDVGVYTISFANMVFGKPVEVAGVATLGHTGVDELASLSLRYANGQVAGLICGSGAKSNHEVWIHGTKGQINLHSRWWIPVAMTVHRDGEPDEHIEMPLDGNGYNYEAAELMRCVSSGELESPVLPHDEILGVMETMDTLRRQWGLKYPAELATDDIL